MNLFNLFTALQCHWTMLMTIKCVITMLFSAEIARALAAECRKETAERESRLKGELMAQKELSHQQIVSQLNRHADSHRQQIQRSYDELTAQKLEEQERLLREGFSREADRLRAEIDNLRRCL